VTIRSVNAGAAVNVPCLEGMTALHWAAKMGYVECVDVLLNVKGILVNWADGHQSPPLCASNQLNHHNFLLIGDEALFPFCRVSMPHEISAYTLLVLPMSLSFLLKNS
jgi:ankyrin repeat protein